MENFLASVEKRAYRMAAIATGNDDTALDLVQDAMLELVRRYQDRRQDEWRPLFYRILQNKIRDWYRRQKLRKVAFGWLPGLHDQEQQEDPFLQVASQQAGPEQRQQSKLAIQQLEEALGRLPLRQQQVFLLRAWEEFSTQETAAAMGCSTGTVKTHYSRALQQLRQELEDHWP